MSKNHIKKSREGLKFHPIDRKKCFSNPEVDDKIKQIIADKNKKSSAKRNWVTDQKKNSFFLGYLITRLSLNHFQRPSAVGGMMVEEFQGGIQQSVPLEFGEGYLIEVAEHKKHNMPASFFIHEFEKKLVKLYLKRFRPDSDSEKVFLMLCKGSGIENASKITSEFQAKYGLAKVSPTDMKHALVQIEAFCPEKAKSEADISAISNHSKQTARSHYPGEIAALTTRKQMWAQDDPKDSTHVTG